MRLGHGYVCCIIVLYGGEITYSFPNFNGSLELGNEWLIKSGIFTYMKLLTHVLMATPA